MKYASKFKFGGAAPTMEKAASPSSKNIEPQESATENLAHYGFAVNPTAKAAFEATAADHVTSTRPPQSIDITHWLTDEIHMTGMDATPLFERANGPISPFAPKVSYDNIQSSHQPSTAYTDQERIVQNENMAQLAGEMPGSISESLKPKEVFDTKQYEYGNFWWRLLAITIDTIIVYLGLILVSTISVLTGLEFISGIGTILSYIVPVLYFAIMESSSAQASLGKMMLGMKVINADTGQKIGFWRAFGRYFAKVLNAIILFIGYIMALFTERKQGLHDLISNTLVIRRK